MSSVTVQAPAKVNLYLHVTGKRADGYHLLDSLFVFAKDGDVISVSDSEALTLELAGPYAAALSGEKDNIILKAARLLAAEIGIEPRVKIKLEKNLPVASGIGGGSSDAAATLKALLRLWKREIPAERLEKMALALGADVPSCLKARAVQVAGVGEILTKAPELPFLPMLLINPNRPVATPAVFKARKPVFSPADPFTEKMTDFDVFVRALAKRRNDLSEAACSLEPAVARVLQALAQEPLCRLARMSGSGGTCFGIFKSEKDVSSVCEKIRKKHPDWWFLETAVL